MARSNGTTAQGWDRLTGAELVRFALQASINSRRGLTVLGLPLEAGTAARLRNNVELDQLSARALADPLLSAEAALADALIAPPAPEVVVPASEAPPVPGELPPTLPVSEFVPSREERLDALAEPPTKAEEVAA